MAFSFSFLGGDYLTINKGKLLKGIGWTAVGVGLYLVGLGALKDSDFEFNIRPNMDADDIIDAVFEVVEE